ncbi:PHP domain-containing protein [Dendrosporobacter sp. 1207_IL3150]|uniref:PHP domain-containing protein n=1 Tax=Dendrosporobacter sp. 1207_IL3150 TaxID=3084054 RepID=UPI002FD95F96
MKRFKADLHIHSVLSPCAAGDMTPANIIFHAEQCGLDIIALTDHNACDNVPAIIEAAKNSKIIVIPGMEVETQEEIHVIVLFETLAKLNLWENYVQRFHCGLLNDERRFGPQFIVDANGDFINIKAEMLLAPLKCPLAKVVSTVESLGGICIASHIDRPSYSVISQLGFIPSDVKFNAVEVSRRMKIIDAAKTISSIGNSTIVTSSDAHTISDLISGPHTCFELKEPSFSEICMALAGEGFRRVVL